MLTKVIQRQSRIGGGPTYGLICELKASFRVATRAFTLIELLVVVSIIAVLVSILIPALGQARQKAWEIACLSNQRQCLVGMRFYASDFNDYWTVSSIKWQGNGTHGWQSQTAGYLGLSAPWTGHSSAKGTVFECPSFDRRLVPQAHAQYLGGIAYNGYFGSLGMYPASAAEILANVPGANHGNNAERWRCKRFTEISKPWQTIVIGDGRDSGSGSAGPGFQMGMFMRPPITEPRRHRGALNVGWIDGHASRHQGMELDWRWLRHDQ